MNFLANLLYAKKSNFMTWIFIRFDGIAERKIEVLKKMFDFWYIFRLLQISDIKKRLFLFVFVHVCPRLNDTTV